MKKILFALGMLAMFAVTACDDSASSGDSNGSGSNTTSSRRMGTKASIAMLRMAQMQMARTGSRLR